MSEGWRGALGGGAAVAAAVLAVACGGGQPASRFHASRVLSFGDESSLLVDAAGTGNGSKYSVNAVVSDTDPTLSCAANPLWNQTVASLYGLVFPECNPGPTPVLSPPSRIRATFGARAADLSGQIDAQQAESPIRAGDIATVLVGENDVIAEYMQYPTVSEAQLIANVEAEGAETARQVNRLTDLGAKVLLSTIPDVGVTPFAVAERAGHLDTDRAALLTRLTARYNAGLRATIVNDGRLIGLILLDEFVDTVAAFPGVGGFTNVTDPVCDLSKSTQTPPSILDCTAATFVLNGTAGYLWADDRHMSSAAQTSLGSLAVTRAQNNPF